MIGHLRPVKDPFRVANAVRLLPASSQIKVLHAGAALSPDMESEAVAETESNPRYCWRGELPRWKTLRLLASSRLLVLTSQMEGGANVISEALACSIPVISSRISGSIGLLGPEYPGYFPVGDTRALADLLHRVETDHPFYLDLKAWCHQRKEIVSPEREKQSWECLLQRIPDHRQHKCE